MSSKNKYQDGTPEWELYEIAFKADTEARAGFAEAEHIREKAEAARERSRLFLTALMNLTQK